MKRRVLSIEEWETNNFSLVEGEVYDKAVNWLSKNFGGKVSKVDDILDDIRKSENDYADEWEDIISDIDALEVEKTQTNSDPAERKKLDRVISRKDRVLDALQKKHDGEIKRLKEKGEKLPGKNERLKAYWELELANLEIDIAEDMYRKAKDLSSETTAKSLYRKYESAMDKAKKRDAAFRSKYGSLIAFKTNKGKSSTDESSLESMINMTQESFESRVKTWDKSAIKKLVKYLRKERNESYATMDREKESLSMRIKSNPNKKAELTKIIREISAKYMKIIRDLRTKITVANRYA